jgi:hypothetical protein
LPHIIDVFHNKEGAYRALVVGDALYCGVCDPKEDPIAMEILERA